MQVTKDFLVDLIMDNITDEERSSFISEYFDELTKFVCPTELVKKMTIPDMLDCYEIIRKHIPNFNIGDYLSIDFEDIRYYYRELIEQYGVSPDRIVDIWPHLLTLKQKEEYNVSPTLIVQTEQFIDKETRRRLLEKGADVVAVLSIYSLSTEDMIKYGADPNRIIQDAMYDNDDMDLVRQNIDQLLQRGLRPVALIEAEIFAADGGYCERTEILRWYDARIEQFAQITPASDKEYLGEKYYELVESLIYDAGLDSDTEDRLMLDSMVKPVKCGIISLLSVIKRFADIYEEDHETIFHDVSYVCSILSA